jgi:hypothetical protein
MLDTKTSPEQKPAEESAELDLNDDTPLAPACDLSGDGTCEACQ